MTADLLHHLALAIEQADPATLLMIAVGLAFLESVFPPLPSETVIVLCAFAGARVGLPPAALIGATTLGAFVSLYALYTLGRGPLRSRLRSFLARRFPRVDAEATRLFNRYGDLVLVVSRFVPGTRGPVACLAGSYGLPPGRTAVLIFLAGLAWYTAYIMVGYAAGRAWNGTERTLPWAVGAVGFVLMLLTLAGAWLRRRLERN